jgi:CBS domain-containing protein
MNILSLLTPKKDVEFLYDDFSLRQALEKMEVHQYSAIPVISRNGFYIRTITEGDLLWFIKQQEKFSLAKAETIPLKIVENRRDFKSVSVLASLDDLIQMSIKQNFVPVVDDQQIFIGIIRRQIIISFCYDKANTEKSK